MESKLTELISKLANLEKMTKEIAEERSVFENMIQDKEVDNNYNIHCVKLEIRRLQNELGSNIVLTKANEKLLRKHLTIIEDMIHRTDNDESSIYLKFEVPNQDDLPYSIHVNIDNYYKDKFAGLVDDPKLEVIIKTKCSAVELIIRETIIQDNNIYHHSEDMSEEERKDFEMNIRREWEKSYHNEKSIKFIHKENNLGMV